MSKLGGKKPPRGPVPGQLGLAATAPDDADADTQVADAGAAAVPHLDTLPVRRDDFAPAPLDDTVFDEPDRYPAAGVSEGPLPLGAEPTPADVTIPESLEPISPALGYGAPGHGVPHQSPGHGVPHHSPGHGAPHPVRASVLRTWWARWRRKIGLFAAAGAVVSLVVIAVIAASGGRGGGVRRDAVGALRADAKFGLGVFTAVGERVVLITAYEHVDVSQHVQVFSFSTRGGVEVASGSPAHIVAIDRELGVAVLHVPGVRPSDAALLEISAEGTAPARGTPLTMLSSSARFAGQLIGPVARGAERADKIASIDVTVAAPVDRPIGGFLLGTEEQAMRQGQIGAPVFDGSRLVGLTVDRTREQLLRVAPAAGIAELIAGLDAAAFEQPDAVEVERALAARLSATAQIVGELEQRYTKLAWARLPTDPRPDRVSALRGQAFARARDFVAPTDVGALDRDAREHARRIGEAAKKASDEVAVEDVKSALAYAQLRYVLGVGGEPRVLSVSPADVRGAYLATVRDSEDVVRTVCVLREHGALYLSLFQCPTATDPHRKLRYPWVDDRANGDFITGAWELDASAAAEQLERCKRASRGACLLDGTRLVIDGVRGDWISGSLRLRHVAYVLVPVKRKRDRRVACGVSISERLEGPLRDGAASLTGSAATDIDFSNTTGKSRSEKLDMCRYISAASPHDVPRLRSKDDIDARSARMHVKIERIDTERDVIAVSVFWHEASRPLALEGNPWTFQLKRAAGR